MATTPENQEPEIVEDAVPAPESAAGTEDLSAEDEAHAALLKDLVEAVDTGDTDAAAALVEPVHSADLAEVIEVMDEHHRVALTEMIRSDLDPEVLSELEGAALDQVMGVLGPVEIADAVTQLETDDAVEVLEELDAEEQKEVLEQVPGEERLAIVEGLAYPEDSAGRMMQRELIAVPPFWTVGQTLDHIQSEDELPKDFWEIFVVDAAHNPIGTMPLSWVMRAKRDQKMSEIMMEEQTLIPVAGFVLFLQGVAETIRCIICIRDGAWPDRLHDVEETETVILHKLESGVTAVEGVDPEAKEGSQ